MFGDDIETNTTKYRTMAKQDKGSADFSIDDGLAIQISIKIKSNFEFPRRRILAIREAIVSFVCACKLIFAGYEFHGQLFAARFKCRRCHSNSEF